MFRIRCILLFLFLITELTSAQQSTGAFKGTVIDLQTNQPLKEVLVKLQYTNIVTQTNSKGKFNFDELIPGFYNLEFILFGYQTLIIPKQKIQARTITTIFAEMIKSKEIGEVFYIGGIEVTANKELLPEKIFTTSVIQSSDIEHIQATSLGDVLELVPGVEISSQPALYEAKRSMIRDPQNIDEITSMGTKIIVDDIPISNNANLQNVNSTFYGEGVFTNAGTGIDLREIPADNIESLEVIQGIAPAKYGDYLTAVINLKTKIGPKPFHRIKAKNNPDTKELNLGGTFYLKNTGISYNVNWGYSLKDIRKDYDNVQRLCLQTTFNNKFLDDKISIRNSFRFTRLFEDIDLNPSDENSLMTYNHGYRFSYGIKSDVKFSQTFSMHPNFYITYRKIDSYKQKFNPAANRVLSTLFEDGTMIGIKQYGGYVFKYFTKGEELSLGLELDWMKKILFGNSFHKFSWGMQCQFDDNFGKGKQFDILTPEVIGDRPRSFDSVPGAIISSLYLNDEITRQNLSLNLGLRFEKYSTSNSSFFSSQNGSFINPRINLAYNFSQNNRIHLGFGICSKSPIIYHIYPQQEYLDISDIVPVYHGNDTLFVQDSLKSTYVFNGSNPDLKGYQESKWELGFDSRIGDFGVSLTGFYRDRKNEPMLKLIPYVYNSYNRPNWPNQEDEEIAETYVDAYQTRINGAWGKYDGVELSLITNKIKWLNSNFLIQAAYYHSKHGEKDRKLETFMTKYLKIPYYKKHSQWFQKLILTYKFNYTSAPLGIWVSFTVQHIPHFISKTIGYADSLAVAYYDGSTDEVYNIPPDQRKNDEYEIFHRSLFPPEYELKKYPAKWIFNIRVSKSLFKGAEISLYVNNFLDDRAYCESFTNPERYYARNPEIFYGIECSILLGEFIKITK